MTSRYLNENVYLAFTYLTHCIQAVHWPAYVEKNSLNGGNINVQELSRTDNNDSKRRSNELQHMPANGVNEWERSRSVPKFVVVFLSLDKKILPHGVNNEHELTKNEKLF